MTNVVLFINMALSKVKASIYTAASPSQQYVSLTTSAWFSLSFGLKWVMMNFQFEVKAACRKNNSDLAG